MRRVRNLSAAGVLVGLLVSSASVAVAEDGATLRVAPDGSADHETISAAIAAAADGDTILIGPGTYVEHLLVDKDLVISGQGNRAEVILEPPPGQEPRMIDGEPALELIWTEGVDLTLEGLTFGPRFGYGIVVNGGTAAIRDILIPDTILVQEDAVVTIEASDLHLLNFHGPNETTVTDSVLRNGAYLWDSATATFENNEVVDMPIVSDGGARITVVGNTFAPTKDEVGVLIVDPESFGYIADNTFTGGWAGVIFEYPVESTAERNTIEGAANGIVAVESGSIIRDNTISDASEYGIQTVGEGMTIADNVVEGGRVGFFAMPLPGEAHPRATDYQTGPFVSGNTITGASHFGVLVEEAPMELSDNTICAGREPLKIEGGENLVLGTNEICETEAD